MMKRTLFPIICILILLTAAAVLPAYAESVQAEDLTDRYSFDFGGDRKISDRVLEDRERFQTFGENESFSVTREEPAEGARLCVSWQEPPADVSVLQYAANGTILRRETLIPHPDSVILLLPEATKAVVQAGEAGMKVLFCAVYGAGELPEPFHEWQETPDRLDYLLISTHPDDDVLFLGSIVPTYGAEKGFVGSIVYVTCQYRVRADEAENGAWTMGLRYRPVFLGMQDVRNGAPKEEKAVFRYDELLVNTVRVFRKLRPLVVFAQDLNGEYGHWQHKLTAKAAREAFALAADPEFDPESAEQYGTWQVQKLYLHLYSKNTLTVDAHAPLSFFGGKDAFEVACEAFLKHATQQRYRFRVRRDNGKYAFNRFGMAEGVVPAGEDVFDNIDERLLFNYVEPVPEPTAAPTPKVSAAPTAVPVTPAPTDPPQNTAAPDAPEGSPEMDPAPLIRIAVITVITAAAVGVAAYFWKKRQIGKQPPEDNTD